MFASKIYKLSLSLALALTIGWFWSTRIDELSYHTIGSGDLVDIGDARSFAENRANFKDNSYVKVSGILGNKAATMRGLRAGSFRFGRYQVRHLLGSKIYIEYDQDKYHKLFNQFSRVEVTGRLVNFGPGSELQKVRDFFKDYYNTNISDDAMLIVVDEKPRSEFLYGLVFVISVVLLTISFYFSFRNFRS